jgi:uncharacterized lipoprotein YmbA
MRNAWALCCFVLLAAGCASAPPDHFYTLIGNPQERASGGAANQTAQHADLAVMIASVTLPDAVDRAELVIRTGPNSVKILEDSLWAEPLKSAIPRAVAGNLSDLLGGATVAAPSDLAGRHAKYRVSIDVTRFDAMQNEAAVIEASWSIKPATGEVTVGATSASPYFGRSTTRAPVHGDGVEQLVAADAQALAGLSAEIAAQIQKMESAGN